MEIKLIIGGRYAVSTDSVCRVTYMRNGKEREYVTAYAGKQEFFVAQSQVAYIDDENADVTLFPDAPTAIDWLCGGGNADGLPVGFTRVEYLETNGGTSVLTDITFSKNTGLKLKFLPFSKENVSVLCFTYGEANSMVCFTATHKNYLRFSLNYISNVPLREGGYVTSVGALGEGKTGYIIENELTVAELNWQGSGEWSANWGQENLRSTLPYPLKDGGDMEFFAQANSNYFAGRLFFLEISEGTTVAHKLVPALDTVGAPCMFDLATKTPYYNRGTGDFLYPGKEATATTYSLRAPRRLQYAQMTEHGIRRLYHVPRGYNGTPEEYAEQNGFKILVETEQPAEGYWAPQWRETEDCIELEWIETEPPANEEEIGA